MGFYDYVIGRFHHTITVNVCNENRYAWTDEGRVDLWKSVLIFEKPKVLLVGP